MIGHLSLPSVFPYPLAVASNDYSKMPSDRLLHKPATCCVFLQLGCIPRSAFFAESPYLHLPKLLRQGIMQMLYGRLQPGVTTSIDRSFFCWQLLPVIKNNIQARIEHLYLRLTLVLCARPLSCLHSAMPPAKTAKSAPKRKVQKSVEVIKLDDDSSFVHIAYSIYSSPDYMLAQLQSFQWNLI